MRLTSSEMNSLVKVISREMGLHYPPNRHDELMNGIRKVALALQDKYTLESIIKQIISGNGINPEIFRELSVALTINETYFFREEPTIQFILNIIIPEIINYEGEYKIWSAGCSSGEEPYTLAILLKENLPQVKFNNVTIKATDISPKALEKAKKGEYSEWSFRETSSFVRQKYFQKRAKLWQISDTIKEKVEFSILNLAIDSYPSHMIGQFNLILCRNVLIYFSNTTSAIIANNLHNTLRENGWLVTSQVELNDQIFAKFSRASEGNGFFYKKTSILQTPSSTVVSQDIPTEISTYKKDITKFRQQLLQHKKLKKSEEHKAKLISNLENPDNGESQKVMYNKARELAGKREYSESMKILDELMSQNHFEADFFYLYGAILLEISERKRAIEYFKKCLYLKPGHLLSEYMLGVIYRQEGNHRLSYKYFNRAYENAIKEDPEKVLDNSEGLTAGYIAKELKIIMKL